MDFYAKSDIGKKRENNEDAYLTMKIENEQKNISLFMVADGMGGYSKGEVASAMCIEEVSDYYKNKTNIEVSNSNKIFESIEEAIYLANKKIYNQSIKENIARGMGTTVVLALLIEGDVYFANVGDSRAYLLSEGSIIQISKDNSYVQELIEKGIIEDEEAKSHKRKNIITRAVGVDLNIIVDMYGEKIHNGDVLLLCSDGLTNMVEDKEIENILKKKIKAKDKVEQLIELANKMGGNDNITVLVINY